MPKKYYAVKKGRKTGIFSTWPEAQKQVSGYPGAQFKSFQSRSDAETFVTDGSDEKPSVTSDSLIAYVDGSFDKRAKTYSYGVVLLKNEHVLAELSNADSDSEVCRKFSDRR
ncbi:MAG: ribonuclease H family protein [Alkalibacterium sp.]|nr:ribonuclease H family protein [Alkalibacterium sp.]